MMSEIKFSVDEILQLMDKMAETGLGKLEVEEDGCRFSLQAKKEKVVHSFDVPDDSVVIGGADGPTQIFTASPSTPAGPADANAAEPVAAGNVVEAPIVGTFYSAPAPDKPPFVKVGQRVSKGDVLFIIESMKLMNEVQSEFDGEVVQVIVDNETPVEYGQPIMVIK